MGLHPDAWTETDRAVNLCKQNERFVEFFAAEQFLCENGVARIRAAKMLRRMITEFAGYQREEIGKIIDNLEAWGDEK